MKNYKKYIFDLDYTLLIPDWSKEDDNNKEFVNIDSKIKTLRKRIDNIRK